MASTRRAAARRKPALRKAFQVALAAFLAFGVIPACALARTSTALAANDTSIEYIPEDSFTPKGFNWGINFTGVEVVRGFTQESDISRFYPRDYDELARPGDRGFAARITRSTANGSFALRYTGATRGTDKVDALVTLSHWNYVEPIMSNGKTGWDEYGERDDYDDFTPGVFVNTNYQRAGSLIENFNFYTVGLTDLVVTVEFFYAGTNDPYELQGHTTCIDLDVGQKFGFGGATTLAQVVSENEFLSIDSANKLVTSPDYPCGGVEDPNGAISADPTDPLYKLGLVGAYFDTTGPHRGEPCEFTFVTSWKGVHSTAQSFFAMTNEFLTVPNPEDDNADIGKLKVRKTADKTEGVSIGDAVTYTVDVPVHERGVSCRNGYSYTDFEIVDVLPDEMRYIDGSGYLTDSAGRRIEGAGQVVYEGHGGAGTVENTVKFEFFRDYLAQSMRMQGEHYLFTFKAALTEYPQDGALSVSNRAYAHVNNSGAYLSNAVETALVAPRWHVDKTADSYECEVGDVIRFSTTFTQTERNAQCRETVFSDNLPEGMQLIPETVQATGLKGIPEPSISGNRWSYSLDKFNYGDTFTVTYSAIALQSGDGIEQVNLSAAHANNCPDENDPAEVWENTAKLSIEKTADYYEHYIGSSDRDAGFVEYTVVVENTKEGTVANDVVVSDASLPAGLKAGRTNSGDLAIDVRGVPERIDYPRAGSDAIHGETESIPVTWETKPCGTGFETTIDHLPAHVPVTITYRCYPESPIAGWEVVNTATASASNALTEQDTATIWANQPALRVEKTASLASYAVGDFVTYHIKVTNDAAGTLGRNLVISDLLHTKGVELQRDSIKVWDSNGNDITGQCTIHTNRNEPTFVAETHLPIVNSANEHTIWNFGEQTRPGSNPLGAQGETAVYVDYTVAIADADLAGATVENTALAVVDEPNTKTTDDESVSVKGARLSIEKTSDEARYEAGATAHYSLAVTQTREDAVAHDVAITDALERDDVAEIDIDSIALFDDDGSPIKPKSIARTESEDGAVVGFSLVTGLDLADEETLIVAYDATMKQECASVRNHAQADARDALSDSAVNDVAVTGAQADADIEKRADREEALVGESVAYNLSATIAKNFANDVVIKDTGLPDGMPIDRNTVAVEVNGEPREDAGLLFEGNGFAASLGTLAPGDVVAISYHAAIEDQTLAQTRVLNNAVLTSSNIEGERSAQAVVAIKDTPAPSASIAKKAAIESAQVGDIIPYSLSVDVGEADLKEATLEDYGLGEGVSVNYDTIVVTIDDAKTTPSFASRDAHGFTLFLGDLSARSRIVVEYEATFEDDSLVEDAIENSARLSSPSLKDSPLSRADVAVAPKAPVKTDAVVTKTASNDTPAVGERITFEITARAQGGDVADTLISDLKMPDGAPIDFDNIVVAVNGQERECAIESDGNTFSASLGTLAKDDVATITFFATIEDENLAGKKFSNRAVLSSPSLEEDRLAHATLSIQENEDESAPENGSASGPGRSKEGGLLGKTGDAVMKSLGVIVPVAVGSLLAIGAFALARKRTSRGRKRF